MAALRRRKIEEEPAMSDALLLLKVEDLINLAFGNADSSLINFRMLNYVINILARQMRVLEHDVEIRFDEHEDNLTKIRRAFGAPVTEAEKAAAAAKEAAEREAAEREAAEREAAEKEAAEKEAAEREAAEMEAAEREAAEREAAERAAAEEIEEPITVQQLSGTSLTKSGKTRIGAIDAVSPIQFREVNNQVLELLRRTKGEPRVFFALPTMHSNEDFLSEIAKGTASMMDTMGVLQVLARVETAEGVVLKMAEILTQLALSGALPADVTETVAKIRDDMARIALQTDVEARITPEAPSEVIAVESSVVDHELVTRPELEDALYEIAEEYTQNIGECIVKSTADVEEISQSSKGIGDKLGVALRIEGRVKNIQNSINNSYQKLDGVDESMKEQIEAFNELMAELRKDLDAGVEQFQSVNNNAETIALNKYKADYEDMLVELEQATTANSASATVQKRLSEDLKFMSDTIDLFCEEKADRFEVTDGLKEKAKKSRLKGLVSQQTFLKFIEDIENKLKVSMEKFSVLEQEWLNSLKCVNELVEGKAFYIHMQNLKDYVQQAINEQYKNLRRLSRLLGEPKRAIMTRKLSVNSYCGACVTPALMDIYDKRSGAPPKLPAMRQRGPVVDSVEPDIIEVVDTAIPNPRSYKCHRFVGGSHTLVKDRSHSRKGEAPSSSDSAPTKRYTGYGMDGRLYLMEEKLQPCRECNEVLPLNKNMMKTPSVVGGRDTA